MRYLRARICIRHTAHVVRFNATVIHTENTIHRDEKHTQYTLIIRFLLIFHKVYSWQNVKLFIIQFRLKIVVPSKKSCWLNGFGKGLSPDGPRKAPNQRIYIYIRMY